MARVRQGESRRVQLTSEGLARLRAELEHLQQESRAELNERVRQAREEAHGDSGDSVAYEDAKAELERLERRIAELEFTLSDAELVLTPAEARSEVALGAYVETRDREGEPECYRIVDGLEVDPAIGHISPSSPVGQALLGHRPGDEVAVETPGGVRHLRIVAVR